MNLSERISFTPRFPSELSAKTVDINSMRSHRLSQSREGAMGISLHHWVITHVHSTAYRVIDKRSETKGCASSSRIIDVLHGINSLKIPQDKGDQQKALWWTPSYAFRDRHGGNQSLRTVPQPVYRTCSFGGHCQCRAHGSVWKRQAISFLSASWWETSSSHLW